MSIHAELSRQNGGPSLPSNRSFGVLFLVVFMLIATWAWWQGSHWLPWALVAAAVMGAVTLAAPALLTPLNRAWMKLAEALHHVISPVVLGIMFYGVVTPFGWGRRLFGGDPLARRFEPGRGTYWIDRKPPGPTPDSFPHQF